MEFVAIKGTARTLTGKKAAADLRRAGLIPCNLYGGKENLTFSIPYPSIRTLVFTPDFKLAELEIDGKKIKAIVKELQADPVKDAITHIDFQELVDDVKVKVEVPLKLSGKPVALSVGGKLEQVLRKLKVLALPKDLPAVIDLDVKDMDFGHVKRAKDISVEGVTLLHSPNTPVARLTASRAAKEAQAAAAKEAQAAGKKK